MSLIDLTEIDSFVNGCDMIDNSCGCVSTRIHAGQKYHRHIHSGSFETLMYQDGGGWPSLCCVRWYDKFFVTDNHADDSAYVSRLVDIPQTNLFIFENKTDIHMFLHGLCAFNEGRQTSRSSIYYAANADQILEDNGYETFVLLNYVKKYFSNTNYVIFTSLIDLENMSFMAPVISICDEVHDGIHPGAPCEPFMVLLFENEEDYKLARFTLPVTHAWVLRYY